MIKDISAPHPPHLLLEPFARGEIAVPSGHTKISRPELLGLEGEGRRHTGKDKSPCSAQLSYAPVPIAQTGCRWPRGGHWKSMPLGF